MKAIVTTTPGGPDVLSLGDVDCPTPGPHEVLIDIVATAVNRADLFQRAGHYPPPPGASDILGLECSGRIAALGPGVQHWRVGDPVCALLAGGGYAEQAVVRADQLMPIPHGVTLVDAAALPEVTCTVWSMVFDQARLRPEESFLVHGGTSGIGSMAIQMAKAVGARVFATAGSAEKVQYCHQLGADVAINYREHDFAEVVARETGGRGVDVVLDIIGGNYLSRNVSSLAMDGRLAIIGMQGGTTGELKIGQLLRRRGTLCAAGLRARPDQQKAAIVKGTIELVWPLVEKGQVAPVVHQVFPLSDAAKAHRLVESSGHLGKVLLQVRNEPADSGESRGHTP